MIKKERRDTLRSQTRLIKAFFELLKKQPYEEINISRICEEAKITRMTFYRYFNNKEDLIRKSINSQFETIKKSIIVRHPNSNDALNTIVVAYFKKYSTQILCLEKANLLSLVIDQFNKCFIELADLYNQKVTMEQLLFICGGSFNILLYWAKNNCRIKESVIVKEICNYTMKVYE